MLTTENRKCKAMKIADHSVSPGVSGPHGQTQPTGPCSSNGCPNSRQVRVWALDPLEGGGGTGCGCSPITVRGLQPANSGNVSVFLSRRGREVPSPRPGRRLPYRRPDEATLDEVSGGPTATGGY